MRLAHEVEKSSKIKILCRPLRTSGIFPSATFSPFGTLACSRLNCRTAEIIDWHAHISWGRVEEMPPCPLVAKSSTTRSCIELAAPEIPHHRQHPLANCTRTHRDSIGTQIQPAVSDLFSLLIQDPSALVTFKER